MKYYTELKISMAGAKLLSYWFLSFMLASKLFASDSQLQFEIVPFDYADADMKEQLCAMVRDDLEIQQRIYLTEESVKTYVSNLNLVDNRQCWVCRSQQEISEIYGFMTCIKIDTYYCFKRSCGVRITEKYHDYVDKYTLIDTMKSVGHIQDIAVHKNYRCCGVAQALLRHFEDDCKKNGMQKLMMHVAADNEKAIHAYNKAGFVIALAYSHDMNCLAMFKSIH